MISFLIILAGIPLGIHFYIRLSPQFGGRITKALSSRYQKSPQWRDGAFQNELVTTMNISFKNVPGMIRQQFSGRKNRAPKKAIPIIPFNEQGFVNESPSGYVRVFASYNQTCREPNSHPTQKIQDYTTGVCCNDVI